MRMDEKKVIAKLVVLSAPAYLVFVPQCDYDPLRLRSGFELADQVVVEVVDHRYSGA